MMITHLFVTVILWKHFLSNQNIQFLSLLWYILGEKHGYISHEAEQKSFALQPG